MDTTRIPKALNIRHGNVVGFGFLTRVGLGRSCLFLKVEITLIWMGGRHVTKGEQSIAVVQPLFWARSGIIFQRRSIRHYLRRKGKDRLWKLAFDTNRQTS